MEENRSFWPKWAHFLQRWGLNGPAAALLEAAGPLTVIAAQLLYFGQPFVPGQQSLALAEMLENRQEGRAFAAFLREEDAR
jgi:hypothetical protein